MARPLSPTQSAPPLPAMARPLSPTVAASSVVSNDPHAIRRRMLQLEETSSKAWADRSNLESRVLQLECERKATAQGFDSIAMRLRELGNMVHDLPPAPALHSAVGQLQWLPESKAGGQSLLGDMLKRIEGRLCVTEEKVVSAERRMAATEATVGDGYQRRVCDAEERMQNAERRMAATEAVANDYRTQLMKCTALVETKVDKADHALHVSTMQATSADLRAFLATKADAKEMERLAETIKDQDSFVRSIQAKYNELRTFLDAKADKRDAERLAEAFNQSYRDFVKNQQEVWILERNYNELSSSLSTLDDACQGLKKSFVQRQEDATKSFSRPDTSFPWPSVITPVPPAERLDSPVAFQRRSGATSFKNSSTEPGSPVKSAMGCAQ